MIETVSWILPAVAVVVACTSTADAPPPTGNGPSGNGAGSGTGASAATSSGGSAQSGTGASGSTDGSLSPDAGPDASVNPTGGTDPGDAELDGDGDGTETLDASELTTGGTGGGGSIVPVQDAWIPEVSFVYDPPDTEVATCTEVSEQATSVLRPIDIVFIIDNSSSMAGEIQQVQDRINEDFADVIGASGIDYRVIMFSRYGLVGTPVHGSENPICIGGELGGTTACADPQNTQAGHNPPRFYHYSADVESWDPWCKLLAGFDSSDELENGETNVNQRPFDWTPIAPNGWSEFLRQEAFKVFVMISDDSPNCQDYGYNFNDGANGPNAVAQGEQTAADFDEELLALSPEQFGTAEQRNYVWHSIVGMIEYSNPTEAWPPTDPIQTEICPGGAVTPGTGHQALSIMTGGLRYPSCRNDDFYAIFNAIAVGIIEKAAVSCEFDVPPPEQGVVDPKEVKVEYTPGGEGPLQTYEQVPSAADCGSGQGFYFDPSPTRIVLCPETCTLVQADEAAQVSINLGCLGS